MFGGGRHGSAFWQEESDRSNAGVLMMQKLGWKAGQGLGKESTGRQSFVRAKMKQDQRGIGHKHEQHIQQQEQLFAAQTTNNFNQLLQRLNNEIQPHDDNNKATETERDAEQKEEISNRPTASSVARRINVATTRSQLYSRFKRGKQLQNYTQRDMNEILGTHNKNNKTNNNITPTTNTETITDDTNETLTSSVSPSPSPSPPAMSNIITQTSNVSMNDYFLLKKQQRAKQLQEQKEEQQQQQPTEQPTPLEPKIEYDDTNRDKPEERSDQREKKRRKRKHKDSADTGNDQ